MSRFIRWATPVVAFALLFTFAGVRAIAEEAKKETGTVSGVVTDKDGKPVAGAEVGIYHPMEKGAKPAADKQAETGDKAKKEKPVSVVPVVKSDDKGEFTLSDVPAGDYSVRAFLKGQGTAREKVSVKVGETTKVELKLAYKGGGGAKKAEGTAK
jgi:hypothetical protein